MISPKPVVVYAASGYTGRLVCEALTTLRIPFIAAGRSQQKLEEVAREMRGRGADCEARSAEHTEAGLYSLLYGAKLVINTSGPFSLLGHAVVDAALAAGTHYLDITGEQDFMFDLRRDYGRRFAEAGLLLSPSAAFLWAPGTAAAERCLDVVGIDTVDIYYAPPSLQTVASLQSMIRSVRRGGGFIHDGRLVALPPAELRTVSLPDGEQRRGLRIPCGEATFLQGDPRVKHLDTLFVSNDLAKVAPAFGAWQRLSRLVDGERLDEISDALVLKLKKDPPPEDVKANLFVVSAVGRGAGQTVRVLLSGSSPYISTGFLGAMAAQALLEGKATRFGYASLAQTFGADYVLGRLQEIGTRTSVHVGKASRRPMARPQLVGVRA